MKSFFTAAIICLALALSFFVADRALAFEQDYDRPGGEFVGKHVNVNDAQTCYNICAGNPNCVAFTWVKPNIQGPTGVCWLKGGISKRVRNSCCVSGVVRQVAPDRCQWYQKGTTYTCYCQNSRTQKWYVTNPGACPAYKPPPVYGDQRKRNCPPGTVWVESSGTFGQGSGYCKPK